MRSMLAVVVLVGVAHADRKPPTPAESAAYKQALAAGRAAQAKKDWRTATARLTEASKAIPDDATALGELGWTAYLAGDLATAEALTRQAIAANGSPEVAGAIAYNLGLIEEKRGDKAAAIAAYRASIKARPHGVVRAALAKLDPAAAKAADPFAPIAMVRVDSLDAFCKRVAQVEDFTCECTHAALAPGLEGVHQACSANMRAAGNESEWLALQRAGAWYVTADEAFGVYNNRICSAGVTKVTGAAQGKSAQAVIAVDGGCDNGIDTDTWHSELLVVLGTRAGAPMATTAIAIKRSEQRRGDSGNSDVDIDLKVAWQPTGPSLAGKTKGLNAAAASDLLGAHDLGLDR